MSNDRFCEKCRDVKKCNMKKRRQALKITRIELAGRVGLSKFSIERYERNIALPLVSDAIKIARALGSSVEEIWRVYDD